MIRIIHIKKYYRSALIVLYITAVSLIFSCNPWNDWDDHYNSGNPDNGEPILSQIRDNSNYSKFYEKLTETGYDTLLLKDQYFTVFVPENNAFDAIPQYTAEEWKKIIGFHICYSSLFSRNFKDMRILTITGKYLEMKSEGTGSFIVSGANINMSNTDQYFRNGVIHETDHLLIPKKNIYEYIYSLGSEYSLTQEYLSNMDITYIDLEHSSRIGVDDEGNTIYDTVWAKTNNFLDNVARINDETDYYTAVLIRDADVWAALENANQYFGVVEKLDKEVFQQILSIVYSAAFFKGSYTTGSLPDTMVSVTGKALPVNDISFSPEVNLSMSNGVVHILDGFNIPKEFFLYPIVREADERTNRRVSSTGYSTEVKSDSRATRGTYFQYGSKFVGDYVEYTVDMVLATKYWIVWTSPKLGGSLYQLSVDGVDLGPQVDNYAKGNFKLVTSGSLTFSQFGSHTIRMTVSGQTIPGYNSIYLDYIKFIPGELYKP
jgi:hypothetical protein